MIKFGEKEQEVVFLGDEAIAKIKSWTDALRIEEQTFPVGVLLIIETPDKHTYRIWRVRKVIVQEDMVRIDARACSLKIFPSGRITITSFG